MRGRSRKHTLLLALTCALASLAVFAGSSGAASNWTLRQLPPSPGHGPWGPPLSGVSCPTESLCVAVGGLNTVAFSQAPTGGAARWQVVNPSYPIGPGVTCVEGEAHCHVPSGAINAVSCASEALCVAVTYDGFILVSTDPTGGAATWTATSINEPHGTGATHLIGISCPSPSLCVAVSGGSNNSNGGRVLTSTNPAAGQWQVADLGSSLDLRGVSCGTPSLCVTVARGGRIFASTNPTGGASAWREAGTPGGPGDLEGVSCVTTVLCAAGNLTGNMLTSTNPAGGGGTWSETNAGGSVQITGVSCPTAKRCAAVDNNGDVLTSADPTGGAGSWHFENLVAFRPTEENFQPPRNALFAASCASTTLCTLVGIDGRIFTATDPFAAPDPPRGQRRRRARRRPRTILLFAEHFWEDSGTRHRRLRARFRFYSPTRTRGFECKRDRRRYRRCRSPLRYWVGHGRHVLRVRAIGPTGLRGPAAVKRFRVRRPHR
jgi:hypothetical protein